MLKIIKVEGRDWMMTRLGKYVMFYSLIFIVFLLFDFVFAQLSSLEERQIYVCPLATKIEEINPKCKCRIDLVLGETVTSTCSENNKTYEMFLAITEYEGKEYFAIYGFENGGAGVNLKPEAKISGEFQGIVDESLSFSGKNSFDPNGDPLEFYWDFGDGNFAQGENATHVYKRPGNYLLKLEITDGLLFSFATATVTVEEKNIFKKSPFYFFSKEIKDKTEKEKSKIENSPIKQKIQPTETKFLNFPTSTPLFKISRKEKIEKIFEKEIEKEKEPLETQPAPKTSFPKENFLANLFEILKGKISKNFLILISLSFLIFLFLIIKNYFLNLKKKKV